MDGPDFIPRENEEVCIDGLPGLFRIRYVHLPAGTLSGLPSSGMAGMVTVEPVGGTALKQAVDGISWTSLRYIDETRPVRRTIEWLMMNPRHPGYIVDYDVKSGRDLDGDPAIYVRFLVDPDYLYKDGKASEAKVTELNAFLDEARNALRDLDLPQWISVRAGEVRREANVAC
jgi:hypothetical protein